MPIYEYVCQKCQESFELLVSGSEKPACPSCGGQKLEKQFSVFGVSEGKKSDPLPPSCQGCGQGGGPSGCPMSN